MEDEKNLTETAVETVYDEEREQQLAEQEEAERIEQNFENARERAEEKSDVEVEDMYLPF
jgi:hypothetical protein